MSIKDREDHAQPRTGALRHGRWFLAWAAIGALGYTAGDLTAEYFELPLLDRALDRITALGVIGNVAAAFSAVLVLTGMWILMLPYLSDRQFRKWTDAAEDEDLLRMRRMLPLAGWGMLLQAAIILVFLIPNIPPMAGISIGLTSFGLTGWLFWRGTTMMDELEQAAQREALMATFIIIEALAIGWALLAHFGFAPPLEPLAVVLLVTVIYFAASVVTSVRRGLTE